MERIGLKLEDSIGTACATAIERTIDCVPGVVESQVNFELKLATVRYDRHTTTAEAIIQAVTTAGYQATSIDPIDPDPAPARASSLVLNRSSIAAPNYQIELCGAIVLCLLLAIGSQATIGDRPLSWMPAWLQQPIGQSILATLIQFWCGRSMLIDAVQTAWYRRQINLNTLVAVSTGAAYGYFLFDTFTATTIALERHSQFDLYYPISAITIALTLWGHQLERQATAKMGSGMRQAHDRPIFAQIGQLSDRLYADKVPTQRRADRLATPIVLLSIGMAIVTISLWSILNSSLSVGVMAGVGVLMLACPAGIGLATSLAIAIGTRKGRSLGIVIHNRISLEVLGRVNTIVFAKTGTLTTGRAIVTNFIPVVDKYHGNELAILQLAASLADRSHHPLASAIVKRAKEQKLALQPVTQFQENIGNGASGIVNRQLIQIGTSAWIDSLQIATVLQAANHQILTNYQQQWEAVGNTVLWIAIDREIAGIIGMSDEIEPTASATISRLKQLGLEVVLLTGDILANTDALAQHLGIDRVFTQLDPQGKAQIIKTLQSTAIGQPTIVAMVGSGSDDAPALAQADVGIAIHAATAMAIAGSDLTIMTPDLAALVTTIRLGRLTLTNINQNLLLAFIPNIICIPIATGILEPVCGWMLTPAIVSGATILSLVAVFVNAARLSRFKG
ncbi:heavy metal translocating P-type ATPase [Chamaesiphon sp.]|uniref:heavy metal translocating P-type ATPase n=1 Tax=Chamaesiphon sp. TaxID=2814140 RepID=UPI0035942F33